MKQETHYEDNITGNLRGSWNHPGSRLPSHCYNCEGGQNPGAKSVFIIDVQPSHDGWHLTYTNKWPHPPDVPNIDRIPTSFSHCGLM